MLGSRRSHSGFAAAFVTMVVFAALLVPARVVDAEQTIERRRETTPTPTADSGRIVVAPTDPDLDFTTKRGFIQMEVFSCSNNLRPERFQFADLAVSCTDPAIGVEFQLDLGEVTNRQSTGDVVAGGIHWEPPLGPETLAIARPFPSISSYAAFCDVNYSGEGAPNDDSPSIGEAGEITVFTSRLTSDADYIFCTWFLIPR